MGQSVSTGSESYGEGLCDEYGEKVQSTRYSEADDYSEDESYDYSQDDEGNEYEEEEEDIDEDAFSAEDGNGVGGGQGGEVGRSIPAPQDSSNRPSAENSNGEEKQDSDVNGTATFASPSINLLLSSDEELKAHLCKYVEGMTKFDIRNIASEHHDNFISMEELWYTNNVISIDKTEGTVNVMANGDEVVQKSHMDVALCILKLSSEIRALRFKLVPAKLSEYRFWSAVFFLLENCSPDSLGSTTLKQTSAKAITLNNSSETSTDMDANAISQDQETATGDSDNSSTVVASSTLQRKDKELTFLRQQLKKTKEELSILRQQCAQLKAESEKSGTCTHRGKWIMSQESIEFVALDEELKEKLREGKRQRLKDVEEQMKFILVSDDVKDSNGKWDCCGETVYSSTCVKTNS